MTAVVFEVFAEPAPQGSKNVVPTAQGWRTKESSEKKVKPYRKAVAEEGMVAFHEAGVPAFTGPVEMQLTCFHARPLSHYGTGRNAGTLKASAPRWKTTAPDLSKVVRATEDALQGIAFVNDARIAREITQKEWADPGQATRVRIAISPLDDTREEVTNGHDAEPADRRRDRSSGSGADARVARGSIREPEEGASPLPGRDAPRDGAALAHEGALTAPVLF